MRVSLRWLGEFITLPTSDIDELAGVFTMLGHEVEGIVPLQADWSDVVVGEVVEIGGHPDADRIRVCQVDTGTGPEQIICGAWNFDVGARVAVARPGAVLPGDHQIGRREIRGVVSNGMICSERELGLGDDHAGILVLDDAPTLGVPFRDLVELPDVVFDLSITPNRPDAMSLVGIARDLSAHYRVPYQVPDRPLSTVPGKTTVTVDIEDPVGCRRFTLREIRGISVGPSPLWVRHRLNKAGIRSISNVVDVTNYVMVELGHPLHAFDGDRVAGNRLEIRRGHQGETLTTLDDVERTLTSEDLIIYDEDGPTSMSGTMGGARSEVSPETTRVLMEAASWDPPTIMYMARRHDLRSEASTRFERGVDPNLADVANQRASAMVASLGGGEVLEDGVDIVSVPVAPVTVELRLSDVERLLGSGFTTVRVSSILESLGMEVVGDDPMQVTVPTFRPDVTRPADLVEEVARIHGYDKFEPTLPTGPTGGLTAEQRRLRRVHRSLAGLGLAQAINLPFVGVADLSRLGLGTEGLLTVKNPLREEESKLRPSMLPGLLTAVRHNLAYGSASVALFETGRVFSTVPDPDDPRLPTQVDRLAWVVVGDVGPRTLDPTGLAADASVSLGVWTHLARDLGLEPTLTPASPPGYHPGRTAAVTLRGQLIGHVGELSPRAGRSWEMPGRVALAELDLAPLLESVPPAAVVSPSVFPHVDFDLSFQIGCDLLAGELVRVTSSAGGDLVESARVFDEFRGSSVEEGKRAVAIRYRLRADKRTLAAEEIGAVRQAMIQAATEVGAEMRGA